MRSARTVLALATLTLFVLREGAAWADALSSGNSTCRDFIAQKVVALEDIVLREQIKCHQNRSSGALDPSVDCSNPDGASFPGAATVAKSASKLTSGIGTKCASASTPANNGYASCPSPCDATVPSIARYSDVAACLICQTTAEATTAIQAAYGMNPPIQETKNTAWKCQNTYAGTAMRTYVKKRLTEQRKCQNKEDKGKIGTTDCMTADLTAAIATAAAKLATTIAKCSNSDLAALTSCAATVSAEQTCVQDAAELMADSLFAATYPEPSAPDDACTLNDHTTATSTVSPSGCAVLTRNTSDCDAARAAAGVTGYWLKFSCRVTLSQTAGGVNAVADGQPDYQSNYFDTSHACYENYTGGIQNPNEIAAQTYSLTFPTTPNMTAQSMMGTAVVGLALNGVPIFGNFAAPGDDIFQEAQTFDRCGAHPQNTGKYHYHSEPYAISYDDSNFVGVMRDGYPIYGRREPNGSPPTLDTYGGHAGVTVDSPSTPVYHYHVNEQTSTNPGTSGQKQWFLTKGAFRGTPGACSGCN